jgi:two-component system, sensor histidine kinase
MEAGKVTVENIRFDIKVLLEKIIRAHTPFANDKGLELKYFFPSNIQQFMLGDSNRLEQILNNLFNNAISSPIRVLCQYQL